MSEDGHERSETSSGGETVPRLAEGPGTLIGPYELLELIGEGGFGSVFLAQQEKPVARRVALKIIKLGMDTRQVIARFEQERQALALMDHPNIARVLDAGATETGRPFFVMDFVKGDPIGSYCDENNLSIDERLDLFAQVCAAVQHAHTKGIIHRDLKPSNVLVATHDGRPHVKVIDFGIAKATSRRLDGRSLLTEADQVIGTLEYMSPEQAEGSPDIDTRTDVYSLGVLLYELLTGSTPLDSKSLGSAMYSEVQRIIREVDPPKPSTRLGQSAGRIASIAAVRGVEPKRLGSIVRGELDWIVMKALEKERQRRYESASAFAADIRRYLGGEAVVAAPTSRAYRLRKFLRRNRGSVIAGAAIAAALCVGVVGFAWQAHEAKVERDGAIEARRGEAAQRAVAERSEEKAAAINRFLLDMLGSANIRELGREAKVAQALARASADAAKAFAGRPEVEAAVRGMLASTYLSIGLLDEAEPEVEAALRLGRSVFGEDSAEFATALKDEAYLKLQRGDAAGAAETYHRGAAIAEKAKGNEAKLTLALKGGYANALSAASRFEEAATILRDSLAVSTRLYGRESDGSLIMINSLAVALHNLKRLDEAEALYREALEISGRVKGALHPDTLTARINYGSLLQSRGKLAEAEPVMREAYESFASVFGDSNVKTATAATVLGELYYAQGRFKEALPLCEEGVAIYRRAQGDDTVQTATAKEALAVVLMRMGDPARAATVQREAAGVFTTLLGSESEASLISRRKLADILVVLGRTEEAEGIFREVIETGRDRLGSEMPTTYMAEQGLGVLYMNQGKFAEAEPRIRAALEAGRRVDGADAANTLIAQFNLSVILRELSRIDEAVELMGDTIERAVRVLGPDHPTTATMRSHYADSLSQVGRNADAIAEIGLALSAVKKSLGEKNVKTGEYGVFLARAMIDGGDAPGAEPIIDAAIETLAAAVGPRDRRMGVARLERSRCSGRLGRFAEAEPLMTESHAILVEARPADLRRAERYLAEFYEAWNSAEPDAARATQAAEWRAKVDAAPAR